MSQSPTATPVPRHDAPLARSVLEFCRREYRPPTAATRQAFPSSDVWAALARTGTALWLDTGDVDAARGLWTREFQALTTNNTLLNKEVQKGIYDQLVPAAAAMLRKAEPGIPPVRLVQEIAFVLNAVHGLKLVSTFDADVSVELHTDLAHDTEASYQYGKRFHAICPDRFIVKVPLTPAGLFAARRLGQDGIRVNFTLGFSARQNYLVALTARPTWVNVFMGRLNAFVADNKLGDGRNVGEKATLASQRLLRKLRTSPGVQVKQIGASMRNGGQCYDLMGLDVFTMPLAAAKEYLERRPAAAEVRDRTADDPPVTFAAGVDAQASGLDRLWTVDERFHAAMCRLLTQDLDRMDGEGIVAFLRGEGAGDLFPSLDVEERARLAKDGKIPVHAAWQRHVQAGRASWDGLHTEAALQSFAQDQKALDDRIRKYL
ncbi:MAG: transaldolase [Planctomycetes bacterium]|nr:transaldolase [Planctomycetota bacterium]